MSQVQDVRFLPTLFEGFKLIGRAPLAILVWGVVTILLTAVPYIVSLSAVLPFTGGDLTEEAALEMTRSMSVVAPLMNLLQIVGGILVGAFVYTALFRAMLRPEDRGFFYLKFSRDEFHVGVVFVVLYILFVVYLAAVIILLMVSVLAPLGFSAFAAGESAGAGFGVGVMVAMLLILAGLLFAAIPALRLGFALPLTFAEGRIVIFEAWRFTRGYTWKLFGLFLLQALLLILVYIVIFALAAMAMGAVLFSQLGSLGQEPDALATALPTLITLIVVMSVVGVFMMPIIYAPWVKVFQLIAGEKMEDSLDVFD